MPDPNVDSSSQQRPAPTGHQLTLANGKCAAMKRKCQHPRRKDHGCRWRRWAAYLLCGAPAVDELALGRTALLRREGAVPDRHSL